MSFQIFRDYGYKAFVNTLQQKVNLFNGATRNALNLSSMLFTGDGKDLAAFENLANLVGNRDPLATTAQTEHALAELLGGQVKVGWGMPNISYTDSKFDWTNRDPAEAGTLFGNDVAEGAMAYMLNSTLYALTGAISAADVTYDGTAATATPDALNRAAGKFGDRRSAIVCWIMHSKSQTDIFGYALANTARLFDYAGVRVMDDGHGRPLIETDSNALFFDNAGTDNYIQLGLVAGAAQTMEQGDRRFYEVTDLSEVNPKTLLTATGSFGIGIKGYKWNTAVSKPDDAAIALTANWPRITSVGLKDTAGVKCVTL